MVPGLPLVLGTAGWMGCTEANLLVLLGWGCHGELQGV